MVVDRETAMGCVYVGEAEVGNVPLVV